MNTEKPIHSPIGASSMHRWSVCPGSVRLSAGIESTSSKFAEEGTLAHEIAAHYLTHQTWRSDCDDEMKEAVTVYTDTVARDLKDPIDVVFLVEKGFDLSNLYKNLYGTADCVIYYPGQKLLRVYDYKHGIGVVVDVADKDGKPNSQLAYYALGALMTINAGVDQVELVIVQPRAAHPDGPVRRFRMPAYELLDFAADLVAFAKKTEDPNAVLKAGDHCKFCPAAFKCPEISNKALEAAKTQSTPLTEVDSKTISDYLNKIDQIEAWIESVRRHAFNELKNGNKIPGYKLVAKKAVRKWACEQDVKRFLEQNLMGNTMRECMTDPELKSVAQVEKALGKKTLEDIGGLDRFIVSISSGDTVVPESDSRPEVKRDAASQFSIIAE